MNNFSSKDCSLTFNTVQDLKMQSIIHNNSSQSSSPPPPISEPKTKRNCTGTTFIANLVLTSISLQYPTQSIPDTGNQESMSQEDLFEAADDLATVKRLVEFLL